MTRDPPPFRLRSTAHLGLCVLAIAVSGGSGGSGSSEYVDNVTADSSLAKYVCASQIASAPGVLTLFPAGTAGAAQSRGYVEYVPPDYATGNEWPCKQRQHLREDIGWDHLGAVFQHLRLVLAVP